MLIEQSISNSKNFKEVSRTLNIIGININSDSTSFDIYYRILYNKDDKDVSSQFTTQVPEWHIDNTQQIIVRDDKFQPILNPEYKEQKNEDGIIINEQEKFYRMPAFDYITMLILDKNIPLKTIMSAYIIEQDADGMFNF